MTTTRPRPAADSATEDRDVEGGLSALAASLGGSLEHSLAALEVLRVHRTVMQRLTDLLAPFDLTPSHMDVLVALLVEPGGELPGVALRQRTLLHSATLTHTLDALEGRGLIVRKAHPTNRRIVVVALTPLGARTATAAGKAANEIVYGLSDLSSADAKALTRLLAKVRTDP